MNVRAAELLKEYNEEVAKSPNVSKLSAQAVVQTLIAFLLAEIAVSLEAIKLELREGR